MRTLSGEAARLNFERSSTPQFSYVHPSGGSSSRRKNWLGPLSGVSAARVCARSSASRSRLAKSSDPDDSSHANPGYDRDARDRFEHHEVGGACGLGISLELVDLLQHLREVVGGHEAHHIDLVLPNRSGGYLDLRTWRRRIWRPAIGRAGVEGVTPYELRHTSASRLIEEWGYGPVQVAELMGNSPDVVWRHYAHAFQNRGHKTDTTEGERPHVRAV